MVGRKSLRFEFSRQIFFFLNRYTLQVFEKDPTNLSKLTLAWYIKRALSSEKLKLLSVNTQYYILIGRG